MQVLKYLFISAMVAASWGVVVYFDLPYYIATVITAVTALIIASVLSFKFYKSRRASKEIERALKAQAEQQANSARPDLEADIRSMQEEFTRAINALKSSRLGNRGATSALYSLPWYVIVGPPGVGKSTALRNSGLKFPFSSNRGGVSVQGVGGTRNCEWWMTSEAVILDTAGRYTTEGGDREEWFAFLDLLRKYRTRRPINGVLAAVSVADIAEAHPEEIASLSREIRARIDEVQDRLGIVVPVYLLFTKCDLLPGFVEMFADLSEEERHQIWGFTLKVTDQLSLADQCSEHFDELTSLLEKRALRRLGEERSLVRRDKIHEHPQYFASLREPIARFVHELTEPNIYHETPILRGVYMTSGTQEGRPLGRIMSSIAEAFGLRPTVGGVTAAPVDAKSYFLGEIFRRVIFPDYSLVKHNRRRTRKLRIVGTIAGSVALVAAIAIAVFPMMSFRYNRELLGQAGTAVAFVEQHVEQDTIDVIAMDRIEPLRRMVETLDEYEEDGAPWAMRMGMYQGKRIYPRLRDIFADTVRRELLIPVEKREVLALNNFVQRYALNNDPPSLEEYQENFGRLRMYLLTTAPAGDEEPSLDANEEEAAWLSAYLGDLWEAPISVSSEPASRDDIDRVASTYVEMLGDSSDLAFERDEQLVADARDVLSRADRTKALTNALVDSVPGAALTLRSMLGSSTIRNDDRKIRPAFTKKGYQETVEPLFKDGLEKFLDPAWVLSQGQGGADELQDQEIVAIQTSYYRLYIDEWRMFLDAAYVDIDPRSDSIDTLGVLTDLTRTEAHKRLFQNVAWHTTLFDPVELTAAGGPGGGATSGLERALGQTANNLGARMGGRALGKTGAARLGVTTTLLKEGAKAGAAAVMSEQRAIADPNTADLVSVYTVYGYFKPFTDFGAPIEAPPSNDGAPPPPPELKPLDEYVEQLKYVRDALQARLDDPTEKEQLEEKLKKARSKVKSLLAAETKNTWGSNLEKLLMPPLELASKGITGDIAKERQNKWCNDVVAGFDRTLDSRYPFNPKGEDMAMDDFTSFFHPEKGELWEFYKSVLAESVPMRGARFELAEAGSSGSPYRAGVVDFLNAANELTSSMFPRGSEDPKVEFEVQIRGSSQLREIEFYLDGESVRYRNGPLEWHSMVWPGEGAAGAKLSLKGIDSRDELEAGGEWGLLRLLGQGTVKREAAKRTFKAQWDFTDEGLGLVQITFRPKSVDTPFYGLGGRRPFMSIFRTNKIRAPRSIMKKAPACRRGRD